ncbi:hypothetical protein ACOMHN_064749 [Nucella lapillus]
MGVVSGQVLVVSVRALLGSSLALYLCSFTMALRENCCSPNFYTCCLAGRKTEVFAFLAEVLGITGMLVFSVDEYQRMSNFSRLSWAHALCDFGLALSLLGSILMACSQHSLAPGKAPAPRAPATPQGYQSLANNPRRSSSLQRGSLQSQASPFTGRTGPRVSGPIPSPAAIAAITAAVSPKQHRPGMTSLPTSPLRKMSSPASYPALDPLSSPARRKSSAQSCHFAGVYNQAKHPPVFISQQIRDDWRMQQSATWSEDMRAAEGGTWTRMRGGEDDQQQQQQSHVTEHHSNTWGAAVERERRWTHNVHCSDRDRRAASCTEQVSGPYRMPPSESYSEYHHAARCRLPPSASYCERYSAFPARLPPTSSPSRLPPTSSPSRLPPTFSPSPVSSSPTHYGSPVRDARGAHPQADKKPPRLMYQLSDPGLLPQHPRQRRRTLSSSEQPGDWQRPGSGGSVPDRAPLREESAYEEERPTHTSSYHGYPNPIPGEAAPSPQRLAQPVVMYHNPLYAGHSPVTETVTARAMAAAPTSPYTRSTLPNMTSHHFLMQHQQGPQHQTFPRQQQASGMSASTYAYVTCE